MKTIIAFLTLLVIITSCSRYSAPGYGRGYMFKKRTNYEMDRIIRF